MEEGVEKWLTSVVYYDKKGRIIQTISQNNMDRYDWVANEYDFSGKILKSKQKHTAASQQEKYLIYLYHYDDMGRLLNVKLSQNEDESNPITINEITYNELGQIKEKKIHKDTYSSSFLQTVDYTYNIKGAITKINDPTALGDNLFAMSLFYNTNAEGYTNQTFNDGKINALQWNSKNLGELKTYTYQYDDLNRLTTATYTPQGRYNVNFAYDLNGNIKRLERRGQILTNSSSKGGKPKVCETFDLIDDLTYQYNGNQLINVSDGVGEINSQLNNDFKDYTHESQSSIEYTYDANGNMIEDKNKGIINIKYNHLNQPTEIDFGYFDKLSKQKTKYIYTATGVKLQTKIFEKDNLKSKTDYSGAFVYENDKLSYTNITRDF